MGDSVLGVSSARGPTTGLCEQEAAPCPEPGLLLPAALLLWTPFLHTPDFQEIFRPAVSCMWSSRAAGVTCPVLTGRAHTRFHRPAASPPLQRHPQYRGGHATNSLRWVPGHGRAAFGPSAPAPRAPSPLSHLPRFPSGLSAREKNKTKQKNNESQSQNKLT